jgi:Cu/Ag efflux pump CusA
MTSLAFILGGVPLAIAQGAGAEMRQSLGTAVFFGMLGVTCFGLAFTPTFYVIVRRIGFRQKVVIPAKGFHEGSRPSMWCNFRV